MKSKLKLGLGILAILVSFLVLPLTITFAGVPQSETTIEQSVDGTEPQMVATVSIKPMYAQAQSEEQPAEDRPPRA